jgi:hypothetical protein
VERYLAIRELGRLNILDESLASPKAAAALTHFSGALGGVIIVDDSKDKSLRVSQMDFA